MKKDPNLLLLLENDEWWTRDDKGFYVPTEKAPPEGLKAMEAVNRVKAYEIKHHCHIY